MSSQRLSQHTDEIDGQGCPAQLLSSDDSKAKKRYLTVDDSTLSSHLKKKHKKHSTYEKDCEIEIDDDNSAEDNKFINLQASLKPFEKEYICNVFTLHSASSYLQYLESKSFKRFSSYLDYSKELVLTGPKGVGKSFTLLAVMATRSRENKPTVLLSVDSLTYIEHTVTYLHMILKEYCGDSKATHSTIESCLNQLVKMPCKSEIMLLVDICSIYSNTARSIENLLRLI